MPDIVLQAITPGDLQRLARGEPPIDTGGPVIAEALAPPFVAERSLQQARAGVPWRWCSTFHVLRGSDQAVVGGCGFKHAPRDGQVEIGYGIAPACRNQGFARQAVRALLQLAFESDEVQAVLACINPDNVASTRVVRAEGFQRGDEFIDAQGERLVRWLFHRPAPASGTSA